jgi:hypothetical protein
MENEEGLTRAEFAEVIGDVGARNSPKSLCAHAEDDSFERRPDYKPIRSSP